jgi:membrane peptidoglycan carboxypeptidase
MRPSESSADVTRADGAGVPTRTSPSPTGAPRSSAPTKPVPVTPVPPLPTRPTKPTPTPTSPVAPREKKQLTKAQRRNRIIAYIAATVMLLGLALMVGTYYVDSVPTPAQLPLPESTTVYYADGKTPMAKLGTENRTILSFDEMNDVVKQAIVAAEDQTFWTNEGVDFSAVMRAAWNNVTGGKTQGASTITQQYARIAADLTGVTFSRKLREAVIAWKLDDRYSKEEILEFYLNTVPFGRGAHGIEAAAQSFFGKTANKNAPRRDQVTVSEAMVLVSLVKQPEPDPNDPEGHPGYDPTRSDLARENSIARWNYVRDAMVGLGYLTRSEADALEYPKVTAFDPSSRQSGLDLPTGLVVQHALAELRQAEPFRDRGRDYIQNGGFRIVTTVDKRAQEAAEAAADIRRDTAPSVVRGQPQNWQAALVAVEPGTGRVLAYYGGNDGAGADYAGWYVDEDGEARGFGQHSPGSSFKVYDLAEAIRQGESVRTEWDSPNTKEFPASGRTRTSAAGPVRNAGTAPCQPRCELWEATVASLNVTFFALTEKLGRSSVIDMARKAGVDFMWANVEGQANPQRVELAGKSAEELEKTFSTEVGIGQFGITVLDHANGMATFAADGKRARAHFVREVFEGDDRVYAEQEAQSEVGLNQDQINELNWTLSRVTAANLDNGWDAAGKTGTWQAGTSTTRNAHTWMVGYTKRLAAAVWLGTTDGKALVTKNGSYSVFGSSYPGPIWRQFMVEATRAMELSREGTEFENPKFADETPTPAPSPTPEPEPSPEPTCTPENCPEQEPEPSPTPPPPPPPPPPSPTLPPTTAPPASLPADGGFPRGGRPVAAD